MKSNPFFILLLVSCVTIFYSCNNYQQVLKSNDFDYKLEKAKEYYNIGQYTKAIPLFEELMTLYKGTKNVEELYYFYPYCHYGQGDYLFASYYFQNFLDYYPRSQFAEEAKFMIAYCFYKMSPTSSLEQDNTGKAVEAFQLFVNTYPESEKVNECNELIDELRRKMETKAYSSSKLYYDMKDYQAAAVSFNNMLLDFPDTNNREKIQYYIVRSYFLLAENSVRDKRLERYNLTVDSYLDYIRRFPESDDARDAEKMYLTALDKITKIKEDVKFQ